MREVRLAGRIALAAALGALLLSGCSREAADWKAAMLTNTVEAYQVFLQQHPHAAQAAEAQTRLQQLIEQRDWQLASAANTRQAYQQFVTQHPDSQWVQEARLRMENFAQSGALAAAGDAAAADGSVTGVGSTGGAAAHPSDASAPHVAAAHRHTVAVRTAAHRRHAPAPAALARARGGSHVVQLGAFRSKASAESEWRLLSARFSTLRALTPRYVAARSHAGRVIRLQVRLSSAAAASGLCATLKRHARACMRISA